MPPGTDATHAATARYLSTVTRRGPKRGALQGSRLATVSSRSKIPKSSNRTLPTQG